MQEEQPQTIELRVILTAMPAMASLITVSVGTLVLIGWQFDLAPLKRVLPGFVAMNPATAVLFILSGSSLFLSLRRDASAKARGLAKSFAVFIILVAAAELMELAGAWHSRADEILFASKLGLDVTGVPNRMAPNTTLNFLLTGLALLLVDRQGQRATMSQALAMVIGFGALLPITGYAYGVSTFRGLASFIPMALHTATAFLFLALGLFFASPQGHLAEVFAQPDSRGVLARQLFPLAIAVTLLLGWLRLWGERLELYESAFGTTLFALTLCVMLAILVRWTLQTLDKLESERAGVLARLHDANRRKDEMIAVVSHDLCSPLTGFHLVIDMLRGSGNRETEDMLDLLDHSTRRMISMVRGLLDARKLESEALELELEDLRVSEVVKNSLEPLAINAGAKNVALRFHASADEPILRADRLRLAQVFNNLLSNAVKFTEPGGRVDVTMEAEPDGLCLHVIDNGLGIPERDLPNVFDKYYQGGNKATGGEKGVGLGLSIVREIVVAHGGRIDVASEVNHGTTFSVFLPTEDRNGAHSARAEEEHLCAA
jgi:signal transduction histidine kinase